MSPEEMVWLVLSLSLRQAEAVSSDRARNVARGWPASPSERFDQAFCAEFPWRAAPARDLSFILHSTDIIEDVAFSQKTEQRRKI